MAEIVKGARQLANKLNKLGSATAVVEQAVGKEIQRVRNTAVLLCPVNHGELRRSIKTMVQPYDGGIRGVCYTNKEHAAYVEFGTGPQGQEQHEGISPNVQPTYTQQGWWFPGKDIDPTDADKYHWPKSEGPDGVFYYTDGQPAQPFMYPALKMNENIITANLSAALQTQIKKVWKK